MHNGARNIMESTMNIMETELPMRNNGTTQRLPMRNIMKSNKGNQ